MTKGSITILKPGPLSLIQDFGRYGLSHLGLTQGGPVDDYAYSWANHLLQNPINCPALEITLGQCTVEVNQDCVLAITGGDLQAKLDGVPIANWSTFIAGKGQMLSFGLPTNGLRAYLAVKGGFKAPVSLTSASTVVREKVGGPTQDGQACQANQQIHFEKHPISADFKPLSVTFRYTPDYNLPLKL
ncbi:allophanate hydrolase, partial [Vibrio fortis]|uniref:5-oxoprolinase subunit C family protein n=1 Tax=Vibrio fortis TaxID=212667 RepID=UPI002F4A282F